MGLTAGGRRPVRLGKAHVVIETPFGCKILVQRLLGQDGPDHFHGHRIEAYDGIMILPERHLTAIDQFFFQRIELSAACEICQLI